MVCLAMNPLPTLSCDINIFLLLHHHISFLFLVQKPVVLTDTKLCDTALKWDLDYLAQHMGAERYMVFLSNNHKFKYYDEAKIKQYKTNFVPPTRRVDLTFPEFVKKLREWKPGDERYIHSFSYFNFIHSYLFILY